MLTARQLLAARESWVEVGRFGFKIRRPSDLELIRLRDLDNEVLAEHFALRCVVDWKGVTEADVLPAVGGEDPAAFDSDLYAAWVADRIDVVQQVAGAVANAIAAHREAKENAQGK